MTPLKADSLLVGFNGQTPVQVYSTSGTYINDLGSTDALAAIPVASGYFTVQPNSNLTSSTVTEWNPSQVAIGSFSIDNVLVDGAPGPNNTLYLSSYDGTVYQTSYSGSVLTSWSTGFTHIGVAFDGTYVYTTEGDTGSNLNKWTTSGAAAGIIATPLTSLYGLGYQSSTGDFWAGSTDYVYELNGDGSLADTLDLPGDSRTPDGAVHDSVSVEASSVVTTAPSMASVPEPGSLALLSFGAFLFLCPSVKRIFGKRALQNALPFVCAAGTCFGAVSVQLTPSDQTALVGASVTWTATASDSVVPGSVMTYQYSVGSAPNNLQVVRDYSLDPTFVWTPSDHEGVFYIQVNVWSYSGSSGTAILPYTVSTRITGSADVVSPTAHPLVALYSMPPCAVGKLARVRFRGPGDTSWQATPFKECNGVNSVNFYVAGMRASTTYTMQHDLYMGPFDSPGPRVGFLTGALASAVAFPTLSFTVPAAAPNNQAYPYELIAASPVPPFANDMQGNVVWYLPALANNGGYLTRVVSGGTFLGTFDDNSGIYANRRLLREWDLAGNLIRETNVAAVSAQLGWKGTDPVTSFSHEVYRLPNGDTAVIGVIERLADQGAGVVDVLGDMAIVLDSNLQLKWYWNAFDHLNVQQPAILGELCAQGNFGCGHLYQPGYSVANDWMHSNSLTLTPDGNLLLSVRHLDWVLKLNYANGTGDGSVLWTLGNGGNFQPVSSSPYPFFTHQHDVHYDANGDLLVFDNGNTRVVQYGGVSRGQAWRLDETNFIATSVFDQNFDAYSGATGSAQLLQNGNYIFYLGFLNNGTASSVNEYTPSGALQFEESVPQRFGYRAFRLRSLYSDQ